jgi:hypothetical protein
MSLVEQVKSEILKENPDWTLVSKLASAIANEDSTECELGFKKGFINFIKVRQYSSFTDVFLAGIDRSKYQIRFVNYVRDIGHIISEVDLNKKISIFISDKDVTGSVSFPRDIPFQRFNGTDSYTNKNYVLKNNQTKERIVFKKEELKSIIRDRKLQILMK